MPKPKLYRLIAIKILKELRGLGAELSAVINDIESEQK
jgi:hypothetical protein